jgi:hypothetical protein
VNDHQRKLTNVLCILFKDENATQKLILQKLVVKEFFEYNYLLILPIGLIMDNVFL